MRTRRAAAVLLLLTLGLVAGCADRGGTDKPSTTPSAAASSAPVLAPSAPSPAGTSGCADATGWGCDWSPRLTKAAALVAAAPGQLGVEILDRRTGRRWRTGDTSHLYWTGSTIKLGLVATALENARTGGRHLSDTDQSRIGDILAFSSDDAADALWREYGRAALEPRFVSRYGMTHLTFVGGFDRYWGFLKCRPADLVTLMNYLLNRLAPADRSFVVQSMRDTDDIQHWGVWAAGPAQRPGNKNGWSVETDAGQQHWLTSSVGFAGENERYVIAEMYSMPPGQDSLARGAHTLSDLSAVLFGRSTPAPAVIRAS
jgi:hypothetical protein